MTKIILMLLTGLLASETQGLARDRSGAGSQIDGFTPPSPARGSRRGYWSTPEGMQATAEIQYQQAQQAFDRTYAQGAAPRTAAVIEQYQHLLALYTVAMSNFGINTGRGHPPFPVIEARSSPITDEQLKEDYYVVLKDYFSGIRLFGLGTAWTQPPKPPPLPPIQNKKDPDYVRFAESLSIDEGLVDKFADRVYAAAALARAAPLPFAPRDDRPVVVQQEQWCEMSFGSVIGRMPC